MSYREQGSWVYLLVTGGSFGAYLAVILGRADDVPLADVPYVSAMLWAIGTSIVLSIIGHIVVVAATARPGACDTTKTDARDRDINRFGEHVTGIVLAAAMAVPLGLTMAGAAHFWIANTMYAAFVLSTLVGAGLKLVAYRRGM